MSAYDSLLARLADLGHIGHAASLLGWDQQCYMPPGGALARANAMSALGKHMHVIFTADETRTLLEQAEAAGEEPGSDRDLTLRVIRRDFDKSVKLPTELVGALSKETALGHEVWVKAREDDDFVHFAPTLQKLLDLSRDVAGHLGHTGNPYDALLNQYEPGMTAAAVETLFTEVREGLLPLLELIREGDPVDNACLKRTFDGATQVGFGEYVIRKLGFDFTHGRQDKAVHPFCQGLHRTDVRLTTRVETNWLPAALMGTIHEAGHGMYEQGFDPNDDDTPLSGAASLGFHESQSRLWENIIGRSRTFWNVFYPGLQRHFPGVLDDISLPEFYRAINRVEPSLIRVEADEVTYCMHIFLRFELEQDLLTGKLAVKDLPDAWNSKMQQYLGITPPNDSLGCLQDVHWSCGMFGYFPTYALGTMLSAQLFEQALKDSPSLEQDLTRGDYSSLLGWLREKVHHPGRRYLPGELIERITGEPLSAKPLIRYLHDKYREIYFAERRNRKRIL